MIAQIEINPVFGPWFTLRREDQKVFSWSVADMLASPALAMTAMCRALLDTLQ